MNEKTLKRPHITASSVLAISSLICCAILMTSCGSTREDANAEATVYRFVDETRCGPTEQSPMAFIGFEHRAVLQSGFHRLPRRLLKQDGTVDLRELAAENSLLTTEEEIAILAKIGGKVHFVRTTTRADSAEPIVHVLSRPLQKGERRSLGLFARTLSTGSHVSKPIPLGRNAELRFALGYSVPAAWIRPKPIRFEIFLEGKGDPDPIYSRVLTPPTRADFEAQQWLEDAVKLKRGYGDTARFRFQTTIVSEEAPTDSDEILTAPMWGTPVLIVDGARPEKAPLNVLVISLDTLRADHLGTYGYPKDTSPNLDRFAEGAYVFEQCIAPSSWTTPSHASLLSGLNPTVHGAGNVGRQRLSESIVTLAELMRSQGYMTAAITEGSSLGGGIGFRQGFDLYSDSEVGAWTQARTVENIVERTLSWIDAQSNHPFFMFMHTYEIHSPYNPPEPFLSRFKIGKRNASNNSGAARSRKEALENQALYDGGIAYTDHIMGGFFKDLEERGLLENTLVLIVSDHGEEFWEHGGYGHAHSLFEEIVHVPFILRLPGENPPHGRVSTLISLSDAFATVLDFVNIPHDRPLDSQSVLPLVDESLNQQQYLRESVAGFAVANRREQVNVSYRTADSKYLLTGNFTVEGSPLQQIVLQKDRNPNFGFASQTLEAAVELGNPWGMQQRFYELLTDPAEQTPKDGPDAPQMEAYREALRVQLLKFQVDRAKYGNADESATTLTDEERAELEAMGYL